MNKTTKRLIIFLGILVSIVPAIYFLLFLVEHMGVPIKSNADGTTEYLMISTALYNGQPIPSWFILLWGLIGLFIIIIGMKKTKIERKDV